MNEILITRRMVRWAMRATDAASPFGKALLGFARAHGRTLFGKSATESRKLGWLQLKRALEDGPATAGADNRMLALAQSLAGLLHLDAIDGAIIAIVFALDRLPLPRELGDIILGGTNDLAAMIGEAAGAAPPDAERRVRNNPLFRLGLAALKANWRGQVELDLGWLLQNVLDRQPESEEAIIALLVGPRQVAQLPIEAFAHVADTEFLRRLLAGARREHAAGVNILIHGPAGTGKTEFARSLAAAAGLTLHSAGEADADGDEPDRRDRIAALQMGQRLLAGHNDTVLLFDEMEDLIGDTRRSTSDTISGRTGSKVFVNRMLETNPVPVIFTTNALNTIDPAILRRMSHVLHLDTPSRETALGMLARIAREEGVEPGAGWSGLVETAPEAASVLRVAARTARLAGEPDGGLRPARALVRALRGGRDVPDTAPDGLDLDFFETDRPIGALFAELARSRHTDVSLLLTGIPGTGKTALAHHLARVLDRPLLVRRASDLLSKWVGETEQRIAEAFAEARRREGVLLFDEVDSLLFDRTTATTSWEVTQVNEMLTWLDRHPLPVVAATNHADRLDPATLRRFVFKLELRALSGARAAAAFRHFFGTEAPAALASLRRLTPGDMAVVARQLRHCPERDAHEIVARLRDEIAAKPGIPHAIGF